MKLPSCPGAAALAPTLVAPASALAALALCALAPALRADTVTLPPSADAAIYSESGALANGAGMHFFAGKNQLDHARRSLVLFDVAGALPPGAAITSAALVLHLSQQNSPAEPVTIHALLESWTEGPSDPRGAEGMGTAAVAGDVTWTERSFGAGTSWAQAGGSHGPSLATTVVAGIGDWTFASSALTAAVQAMQAAPGANFGFLVLGPETAPGSAMRFDSRENPVASVRPRLLVTYQPPCAPPSSYCVGAPNSVGPGAAIAWSGSQSLATNAFTLAVSGAPPASSGLFCFGPGTAMVPFGDGYLCVSTPVRRLGLQRTDASGGCSHRLDFTAGAASEIAAGSTWCFQFLYRDHVPGGAGFNLSDGLQATFCP